MKRFGSHPKFTSGVAAQILGIPVKTLINYEYSGLTSVKRTKTGRRMYSEKDLLEVWVIQYLIKMKHMSFAGVKYIRELRDKLLELEKLDLYQIILGPKRLDRYAEKIK